MAKKWTGLCVTFLAYFPGWCHPRNWPWTDTAGHETCWHAGGRGFSPQPLLPSASAMRLCTSPRLHAPPLLILSDCSEGQCISAAPESGECYTCAHTHKCTYTDTLKSLQPSQPPRTAFRKWYSGREGKEEREWWQRGGWMGWHCKSLQGRKTMTAAGRGREQGVQAPAEMWGKQHPRPWGQSKYDGACRRHSVRMFIWQNSKVSLKAFNLSSSFICSLREGSLLSFLQTSQWCKNTEKPRLKSYRGLLFVMVGKYQGLECHGLSFREKQNSSLLLQAGELMCCAPELTHMALPLLFKIGGGGLAWPFVSSTHLCHTSPAVPWPLAGTAGSCGLPRSHLTWELSHLESVMNNRWGELM